MQVQQSCLVASHELHSQIVYHLLKEHISHSPDYKVRICSFSFSFSWYVCPRGLNIFICIQVVVFCTTGMVTSLMYLILREMKMNVREIHSRKPQLYRTRISDEFRASKRLILVTSDVSARGINYPDVTLVIQVSLKAFDLIHYLLIYVKYIIDFASLNNFFPFNGHIHSDALKIMYIFT